MTTLFAHLSTLLGTATSEPGPAFHASDGGGAVPHARSHVERQAALAATRRSIDEATAAELGALQQKIGDTNDRAARVHRDATDREYQYTRTLVLELVRDASGAFDPLVKAWRAEPTRGLASEFGQRAVAFVDRENRECPAGSGTSRVLLALRNALAASFVADRPGGVLNVFALEHFAIEAMGDVGQALETPATLFVALEHLEAAIERIAVDNAARPVDEYTSERWPLIRAQDEQGLAELLTRLSIVTKARMEATWVHPRRDAGPPTLELNGPGAHERHVDLRVFDPHPFGAA
jgi:hypothetical protein